MCEILKLSLTDEMIIHVLLNPSLFRILLQLFSVGSGEVRGKIVFPHAILFVKNRFIFKNTKYYKITHIKVFKNIIFSTNYSFLSTY